MSNRTSVQTPPPSTGHRGGGGARIGCDFCEIWAPTDPAAEGWAVRIIRELVEWYPYGIAIGLPSQFHQGDRFTSCGECAELMAGGRYRALADHARREWVLDEYSEHVATLRRIHLSSDPIPWAQWQAGHGA